MIYLSGCSERQRFSWCEVCLVSNVTAEWNPGRMQAIDAEQFSESLSYKVTCSLNTCTAAYFYNWKRCICICPFRTLCWPVGIEITVAVEKNWWCRTNTGGDWRSGFHLKGMLCAHCKIWQNYWATKGCWCFLVSCVSHSYRFCLFLPWFRKDYLHFPISK